MLGQCMVSIVFDWLLGPVSGPEGGLPDALHVRPRVLDTDDVADIASDTVRMLEEDGWEHTGTTHSVHSITGGNRIVDRSVEDLSDADRARLFTKIEFTKQIQHWGTTPLPVTISYAIGESYVLIPATEYVDTRSYLTRIAATIQRAGKTRILARHWLPFVAIIPLIVLVTAWIVLEATTALPVAAHLTGWTLIAFALGGTAFAVRYFASRAIELPTGHLILGMTRAALQAQRANNKRDLRVAGYSVLGTLAVGAIGILLVTAGIQH